MSEKILAKIAELEAFLKFSTPAPWDARCESTMDNHSIPNKIWTEYGWLHQQNRHSQIADANLIASARNNLPSILRSMRVLVDALSYYAHHEGLHLKQEAHWRASLSLRIVEKELGL